MIRWLLSLFRRKPKDKPLKVADWPLSSVEQGPTRVIEVYEGKDVPF